VDWFVNALLLLSKQIIRLRAPFFRSRFGRDEKSDHAMNLYSQYACPAENRPRTMTPLPVVIITMSGIAPAAVAVG
jgi:hypothetical protein